jgi:hypothetical protein
MVLEEVLNLSGKLDMRKQVFYALVLGVVFTAVGMVVAFVTFRQYAVLATVFYASLPYSFVLSRILQQQEKAHEARPSSSRAVYERNQGLIALFFNFFLGCALVFFVADVLVPGVFFSGRQFAPVPGTRLPFVDALVRVVANNYAVLLFVFLLSVIYGVGSLMVLVWNAAVLGEFLAWWAGQGFGWTVVVYAPHMLVEMVAYFLAAIAGGLLSAFVVHGDGKKWKNLLPDLKVLLSLSVVYILVAGVIEALILSR